MMRILAAATLLLGMTGPSFAAFTCQNPIFTQGWSQSFFQGVQLSGFGYNLEIQQLYVDMRSDVYNAPAPNPLDAKVFIFDRVPVGGAQAFTNTLKPDTFLMQNVVPVYPHVIETENCHPILTETSIDLWQG